MALLDKPKAWWGGVRSTLKALQTIGGRGGWRPYTVRESFGGAWQRNIELSADQIATYHAAYACLTLISNDISKLKPVLKKVDTDGIWRDVESSPFLGVLQKPNKNQTINQWLENWILSLLIHGNAFILKRRDARGIVREAWVLDPSRVTVQISENSEVFYSLAADDVAGINKAITVPASEIFHDRISPLWHPLVGISPLMAASLAITQGRAIQEQSVAVAANGAKPAGILYAPGALSDESVEQIKKYWQDNYTGSSSGKVGVLADGLKYEAFDPFSALNSQTVEQLKLTTSIVCAVFHVPPYKIGAGDMPSFDNISALNQQYYQQAIQSRIENIESILDAGLKLPPNIRVEFDLSPILRMDMRTMIEAEAAAVKSSIKAPNESRKALGLPPVPGGEWPLAQHQQYSLADLARRSEMSNPFDTGSTVAEAVKVLDLKAKIRGISP